MKNVSRHKNSILAVIVLFSSFSILLLATAWYASGLAPRLMERNYRTVKYAAQMQGALTAIYLDASNGKAPMPAEIERFDTNLAAEKLNITEVGEPETVASIEAQWSDFKKHPMTPTLEAFQKLIARLEELSAMNEKAMRAYEEQARTIGYGVLGGGMLGFALVFLYAVQVLLSAKLTA